MSRKKTKPLEQLYAEHQGKASDKWSLYLTEYDRLFNEYRDQPVVLLEIGIQNGGSLEIWSKYFSNASVLIGCDIDPGCGKLIYDDPRISIILGDANTDKTQAKVLGQSDQFDLIIDDGSHTSSDIVSSFVRYFPHLKENGLFIAEDLHCSYWQEYQGGLFYPFSSLAFFKRLVDIINQEHWRIDKTKKKFLSGIESHFSVELPEELLSQIHSVEFINSMCVIKKASTDNNDLGGRVIAGQQELVVPIPREQPGYTDQYSNAWSTLERSPEESFEQLTNNLAERDAQLAELDKQQAELVKQLAQRDAQLTELDAQLAQRDARLAQLDGKLAAVMNSTSWWLTKPVRFVGNKLRKRGVFF